MFRVPPDPSFSSVPVKHKPAALCLFMSKETKSQRFKWPSHARVQATSTQTQSPVPTHHAASLYSPAPAIGDSIHLSLK